ncbi:MAG: murein hydrolase activator EnvC family protein [Clostridia bacterium]
MKKKILCLILIVALVVSSNMLISFAANKSELEKENSDIQGKIDQTKEDLTHVEENLTGVMAQIQDLTAQISEYQTEIDGLNSQIYGLEEQISEAEANLQKAEEDYAEQKDRLEKRLVALYEMGETTYLDVLLSSASITDFISKYYIVSEIAEYDNNLLDEIENNKNSIEAAKKTLEDSKAQIESLKNSKEATANALKDSQSVKQQYVNELNDEQKSLQAQLDQFEEDKRKIQNELAEIARKEAESGGSTIINGSPSEYGYIFPVAGLSLANINNKSYPSYRGHTGVDVNINVVGKSVVAVKSGTVVTSTALKNSDGSYRSYGEYVVINHHDGTMTLYAHMLAGSRQVTKGQTVSQGQVIGTVGSTGNSTGPHLHFEVRKNGVCVNPLPYLGY